MTSIYLIGKILKLKMNNLGKVTRWLTPICIVTGSNYIIIILHDKYKSKN